MFHSVVGEKKQKKHCLWRSLALCLLLLLVAGPLLKGGTATAATANEATPTEVFAVLNASRSAKGLPALEWDESLAYCAGVRAQEISVRFSHVRPGGHAWYTVDPDIQYGENLMYTTNSRDASNVFSVWASSPAHRALFYDAYYQTAAIAKYESDGTDYWVIEFGY